LFPLFFSMTETLLTSVRDWLEEKFASEEAFSGCYVVDLQLSGSKLAVFTDSDNGLTLDMCRQISRFLEERIEEAGLMPEKYTLEVSSPGLDRPLTLPRQYLKNIGRSLKVHLIPEAEGTAEIVEGKLIAATEAGIELEYEEVTREKGKKKKTVIKREIAFSDIDKSFVLISFK
jgi:ribosome maturation factor RimP